MYALPPVHCACLAGAYKLVKQTEVRHNFVGYIAVRDPSKAAPKDRSFPPPANGKPSAAMRSLDNGSDAGGNGKPIVIPQPLVHEPDDAVDIVVAWRGTITPAEWLQVGAAVHMHVHVLLLCTCTCTRTCTCACTRNYASSCAVAS